MRSSRPLTTASIPVAALAVLALAACGGQSSPDRFPDAGHVVVHVDDTAGHPLARIVADLDVVDPPLVWRSGTTGADGTVEIGASEGGVLPGSYAVAVELPPGYALAPGQAASTPVTVASHQRVDVNVVLTAP